MTPASVHHHHHQRVLLVRNARQTRMVGRAVTASAAASSSAASSSSASASAASASATTSTSTRGTFGVKGFETVGDVMTTAPLVTCRAEMSVDAALELVVNSRVTGLPVVDEEDHVVGVVSDYDLLALEDICGGVDASQAAQEGDMFPPPGATWKAFNEVRNLLAKTGGKKVADVMTSAPIVVRASTNIEDAARILLSGRFRRLPVVNEDNKLVGILTRGNIVSAALMMKRIKDGQKD